MNLYVILSGWLELLYDGLAPTNHKSRSYQVPSRLRPETGNYHFYHALLVSASCRSSPDVRDQGSTSVWIRGDVLSGDTAVFAG